MGVLVIILIGILVNYLNIVWCSKGRGGSSGVGLSDFDGLL